MSGIFAVETRAGYIQINIRTSAYGDAGRHWKRVLEGPNNGGYGRIFIQRYGANQRRYLSCYDLKGYYRGNPHVNIDECPGAMFIWSTGKEASVEPVFAHNNQSLGRDMGHALRQFRQDSERDLWQVTFRFV